MTTNRTILELKPTSSGRFSTVSHYQSHHTGIETNYLGSQLFSVSGYQSHHTGIETQSNLNQPHPQLLYQSHHTGIETFMKHLNEFVSISTNRTILELKLRGF